MLQLLDVLEVLLLLLLLEVLDDDSGTEDDASALDMHELDDGADEDDDDDADEEDTVEFAARSRPPVFCCCSRWSLQVLEHTHKLVNTIYVTSTPGIRTHEPGCDASGERIDDALRLILVALLRIARAARPLARFAQQLLVVFRLFAEVVVANAILGAFPVQTGGDGAKVFRMLQELLLEDLLLARRPDV